MRVWVVSNFFCFFLSIGCTIDFDAPFSQATSDSVDAGAGTGGTGTGGTGTGGTGTGGTGTGGTSGVAGTGAVGGTNTGGSGLTGGTGATGGSSDEVCDNNTDDTGNGLVDCQDPHCISQGYTCLPSPPAPWKGPVQFNHPSPSECTGYWPQTDLQGGFGITMSGQNRCGTCSCQPDSSIVCGLDVQVFDKNTCVGNSTSATFFASGACTNVGMQNFGPRSLKRSSNMYIVEGECISQASGSPEFPPADWESHSRTCQPPAMGGGCSSSEVCVPPVEKGFICVTRPGIYGMECPAGYDDLAQVVYTKMSDTRSCSTCSCSSPTGDCSDAAIFIEDPSGTCVGSHTEIVQGLCHEVPVHPSMGTFTLSSTVPTKLNPSCAPQGGVVQGKVEATEPHTVCCRK